jgi:DNA polymerase
MFLTGVPSGDNATTMLDTVSSCLRGVFVPVRRRATHLAVGDFAQIEARMIAWLAGQQDILDVFARGEDVYVYAAARVGSDNRQLGKANTLALGFGMGAARFVKTAKDYGLVFTEREAQRNVSEWREANGCIVRLWYDFERAAREVLWSRGPKAVAVTNRIVIGTEVWNGTRHLWVQLPSGRRLWYYDAQIIEDRISYQGLNSVTRKWEREETWGGTLAQNATQAAARDVMARALYRINEAKGVLRPLMSVHDEIINEFDEQHIAPDDAKALLKTFMVNAPRWADGLPLAADVFTATRYRK